MESQRKDQVPLGRVGVPEKGPSSFRSGWSPDVGSFGSWLELCCFDSRRGITDIGCDESERKKSEPSSGVGIPSSVGDVSKFCLG